jgi:hypothetical protein
VTAFQKIQHGRILSEAAQIRLSILEREFKIKLKEVVFWTWEPDPAYAAASDDLMSDIRSAARTWISIGLTKLEEISGSMNIRDLHVLAERVLPGTPASLSE